MLWSHANRRSIFQRGRVRHTHRTPAVSEGLGLGYSLPRPPGTLDHQVHSAANDPIVIDMGRTIDEEMIIFRIIAGNFGRIAGKRLDGLHRFPPAQRRDLARTVTKRGATPSRIQPRSLMRPMKRSTSSGGVA